MIASIHRGFVAWRRLGPVDGTRTALRVARRKARGRVRERVLRRRPLSAAPGELEQALGGASLVEQLRGPVLAALPTVARFERELDSMGAGERATLIAVADDVLVHRFDLLGSGPTDLGERIDWTLDFKSGRRWPLAHFSRLPITYPDGSDIKVPWELSRFQHLPLLAAAAKLTGDARYRDEIGAQLDAWIEDNPVEFGPNWACTMDVAIRAANWVAALALCAQNAAAGDWLERAAESLLLHGRFIRSNLEWSEARGNHYLADIVGLLPVAALFCAGREGRAWADWAARELARELEHQIRPDGCDHEASIPYHRLVCELFVCGGQAVDALAPECWGRPQRETVERMLDFVADYTRPDGLAPQIGDADDGRFLPLADYGRSDPRSHAHLFGQAEAPIPGERSSQAYPEGGFFILRHDRLYAIVRCGATGVGGLGAHAHNDQLSFELMLGDEPLVIDPGAFLYTADPEARNLFRSTAFHSTLRLGEREQNDFSPDTLFALPDTTRAEALAWEPRTTGGVFEGRHHGYEKLSPPASHTRRVELDGGAGELRIRDLVSGVGRHSLEWTFPLGRCEVEGGAGRAQARFEHASLTIESPGLEFTIEPGWYSPSYGRRERTPLLRARREGVPGEDLTEFVLRVEAR